MLITAQLDGCWYLTKTLPAPHVVLGGRHTDGTAHTSRDKALMDRGTPGAFRGAGSAYALLVGGTTLVP